MLRSVVDRKPEAKVRTSFKMHSLFGRNGGRSKSKVRTRQGLKVESEQQLCIGRNITMLRNVLRRKDLVARFSHRVYSDQAAQAARKPFFTFTKIGIGVPALALGTWIATSEHPKATAALAVNFPIRLGRDITCAASIVLDYRNALQGLDGEQLEDARRACHLRSANKLQQLCFANGGIYIKLGQVAAQLDHLLPEEYVTTMRKSMLDDCPPSTFAQVVQTINKELGSPPSVLFAEFDERPIASASLAQVHRAVSLDGKELAVKVQHPGLLDTYAVDVATVSVLVHLIHLIFPAFDYSWLVSEIRDTLPKELDFLHEAENADRCRSNFQKRLSRVKGRVHIPKIHHNLCSTRVLTMEYVQGIKVTDKEALLRRHISPQEVARLVSEAFSEMIFIFGDVHCDPHAANLLVRTDRHNRPQLVLLDHGLYKRLTDDFRLQYAALWQALVFGDEKGIKQHTAEMNAGEMYPLFAAMLTQRPWEDITRRSADHLVIPTGKAERELLQMRARAFVREINELLGKMPRDVLLLLKTNDCLRAVDLQLGQAVNTFMITARECSRALAHHRMQQRPGFMSWLHTRVDFLRTEARISLLQAFTWLNELKVGLLGFLHLL